MLNIGVKPFIFTFMCIITEYDRFKVLPIELPYFFLNEGFEFRQFASEFIIVLFSF